MAAFRNFVKVKYKTSVDKARSHLKYIGFRSRDTPEEERGFFNDAQDRGADYQKFMQQIEEHPALQHERTVKMHTMILSMYEEDYRALLDSGSNFKEITREMMADLEQRKGMKLEWIAAVHEKEGHPHVHIAIMSAGRGEDGKQHRLFLDKDTDLPWLRERFLERIQERVPELEKHHERNHPGRAQQRTRVRSESRNVAHSISSLAQTYDQKMKPLMKEKRNQQRRKKRAKSRIDLQRQSEREARS
ncbi:hypothetical protein LLE49_25850 [Alicyclobacillus tolerans]|uniref:relaxase/mobilization nuclease domain-containing protein n=1 Tax=Alicyclobacillus tolerans TaxID=90970 RepID=UPI001F401776|nr:hypothetical protein [Alicyclobacillus tolerans]MCF8568153.1 hypothetical protein [Alicyclobacillus tolerans]